MIATEMEKPTFHSKALVLTGILEVRTIKAPQVEYDTVKEE